MQPESIHDVGAVHWVAFRAGDTPPKEVERSWCGYVGIVDGLAGGQASVSGDVAPGERVAVAPFLRHAPPMF